MSGSEEERTVLSAIREVQKLNSEAGASNDSLNALLRAVCEERGKAAFRKFSIKVMSIVHECFTHFSSVLPKLAKVRAHRDFHQARLQSIPAEWKSFTSAAGLPDLEPLHLQAVSRELFDHCMKEFFIMLQAPVAPTTNTKLLADEENVVRYASGYIGMKLLKQMRNTKGTKAAQYRECLARMSRNGDDSSFLAYTTQWISAVDRE